MAQALNYLLQEENEAINGYFIVGETKERIGVVKRLVADCSEVFKSMLFESDLREIGDVVMPDVHPEAVKIFLKFAYGVMGVPSLSEEMTGWSLETCMHVIHFADKYLITKLKDIALDQLKPSTPDEFFPALHCLTFYGADSIAEDIRKFLEENTRKILQHPQFLEISKLSLMYILKQNILEVKEVELWNAAVSWAKHQVESADDVSKIRKLLEEPLQHIRLLTFSFKDVYEHVDSSNLFSAQEIVDLGRAIKNKDCLYNICSNNFRKRRPVSSKCDHCEKDLRNERPFATRTGYILSRRNHSPSRGYILSMRKILTNGNPQNPRRNVDPHRNNFRTPNHLRPCPHVRPYAPNMVPEESIREGQIFGFPYVIPFL